MTLNQILYFQKIANLENYHQAAEELYISQPSLSRSMASLENELGVTLFEKEGRGVTLTKAGRMFLEYADRILTDCHIAVGKMREISMDGGKIDIGYVFPLAGHYIPHRVKLFLEQPENQKVVFNFWQNHTPAIAKKVKTGELDVGFGGCLEKDDMEFFPVANQKLVIITPKDHPLADKTEITMEELKEYPCLSFDQGSNNSFFLAEEVLSTYEYKRIIKANDRATMLNLMVGLNGYTLCSGIICEELNGSDYRAVPLHADENMMIGYVSRKGMSISAMGLQYLEEIRKYKEFVL